MKYQIEFRYFDNDTKKYVVIDREGASQTYDTPSR
jgi:hypothetical protein